MKRRCLLATMGLLVSASVLSAQTPPSQPASTESPSQQETMEDPQIGDHWTYELRDDVSGDLKSTITHTITDITPAEISVRLAVLGRPNGAYHTYDRAWDRIRTAPGVLRQTTARAFARPLRSARRVFHKSTDSNTSSGVSLKTSGTSKVTAKETLTTRAGTFETFKIETTYESRNSNDATKKYLSEQQTWYAPAINHWVKRTHVSRSEGKVRDRSAVELVEYGRR